MDELEVRADLKWLGIPPTKVRLVLDSLRGQRARDAVQTLRFMPQGAARPLAKLIQSAIANAEENFGLNPEDLFITRAWANGGPTMKRFRAGARGRAKPYERRSSHVTVVLQERAN